MAVPITTRGLTATVTQIQTGPTALKSVTVVNSSGATAFVNLFNAIAANVTLGSTTEALQIEVPSAGTVSPVMPSPEGLLFGSGLCAASTTTDHGTTASAAGVEVYFGVN